MGIFLSDELQRLIDGLADRLGQSVAIDAPDGSLIAVSKDYGDADQYRINLLLQRSTPDAAKDYFGPYMAESTPQSPAIVPAWPELSIESRRCYNIGGGLAYLWIIDRGRGTHDVVVANFVSKIEAVLRGRFSQGISSRPGAGVIGRLLLGHGGFDVDSRDDHRAFVVLCKVEALKRGADEPMQDPFVTASRIGFLQGFHHVVKQVVGSFSTLVLEHMGDRSEFNDSLRSLEHALELRFAESGFEAAVGIAGDVGFSNVRRTLGRAAIAQVLGAELFGQGAVASWPQVSWFAQYLSASEQGSSNLRISALRELLRDRHGYTFDTAAAIFRAQPGKSAAALLNVHRTTLHYRVRQIHAQSGVDMASGADRYIAQTEWLREHAQRTIAADLISAALASSS